MKCYIVRDLLPNYADGLTSEETSAELREHLENCAECNEVFAKITAQLKTTSPASAKDVDYLKKFYAEMSRKKKITLGVLIFTPTLFALIFAFL
jgi:predicted anti-sigma-YlaC factor YlaD